MQVSTYRTARYNTVKRVFCFGMSLLGLAGCGGGWSLESPAIESEATLVLPHTGSTACYQAGSDALINCSSIAAQALSGAGKQDGMRSNVNPMRYQQLGSRPVTDCVQDMVTGLVWEGKTAAAGFSRDYSANVRSANKAFTNIGNYMQGDASWYVAQVNALGLCGYTDWRLPSQYELLGLLDYQQAYPAPLISPSVFPHTDANYWSSSPSATSGGAWLMYFFTGASIQYSRSTYAGLRLVRGRAAVSERASCPSVATHSRFVFSVDGREVKDLRTGLTWQRCSAGQAWSGQSCGGSANTYTHEAALAYAKTVQGWRLPNIKELQSLMDVGCANPVLDPVAFPNAVVNNYYWSATPFAQDPQEAWGMDVGAGMVGSGSRQNMAAVRLLKVL